VLKCDKNCDANPYSIVLFTLKEFLATVICISPGCASGDDAIEYNRGAVSSRIFIISVN